jgi:TrmH family RNA methyltransferase
LRNLARLFSVPDLPWYAILKKRKTERMRHPTITATSNPHIKEAMAVREKRKKYGHDAFLLEGPHLVEMALRSGTPLHKIFFTGDYASHGGGDHLLRQAARTGAQLFQVTGQILSRLSDTETPQGIIALASYRPIPLDAAAPREASLFAVIDGIQDPGNLGTIIRTADAAGADAVILLPGSCDAFMPKTIRSSAGSLLTVPIAYSDRQTLLPLLRKRSVRLCVTDVHASATIYSADLSGPLAFVFGNEAHGASEEILRAADTRVRIPIFGKAESLNVAAAAAICMFEAVRQRMMKGTIHR